MWSSQNAGQERGALRVCQEGKHGCGPEVRVTVSYADMELHRAVGPVRACGSTGQQAQQSTMQGVAGRDTGRWRSAWQTEQKHNSWTNDDHNEVNVELRLSPPEKAL